MPNGFNDFDPDVGDLETVKFYDEYRTDEWNQTSLVIEGDLGFAQLTVAGLIMIVKPCTNTTRKPTPPTLCTP